MYPPVDYPVSNNSDSAANADEMTYAALMDRHAAQQPITKEMIQSACASMEAAQQLPAATRPAPIREAHTDAMLTRLLKAIR